MPDFDFLELTIREVHQAFRDKRLTAEKLAEAFLDRIAAYDRQGPAINSIILVNPRALEEARELDRLHDETGGFKGPLHGIPVLLKDNVNTRDMPTTAGSRSLEGWIPQEDAFITKRLRSAGALILAKTNLHEFAIWGETLSSMLGQTLNPYDLTRTPGGSSGGTGAAIACNFGIIGIGTDTINSIRSPASACNLVGIRPTVGLVSRSGIVPYSLTQDTAGPLCRTVEDCVRTLEVMAGYDPDDEATAWSRGRIPESYLSFLNEEGLRGKRLGVLTSFFGREKINQPVNRVMEEAMGLLEAGGATLIDIEDRLDSDWMIREVSVHLDDLRSHLDAFLAHARPQPPVSSVREIMDSGKFHPGIGDNLKTAMELAPGTPRYNEKRLRQLALGTQIMKIMAGHELDALIYPHQQQLVCKTGGSQKQRNGVLCSATGFPSIAVPAGFAPDPSAPLGVPVGMEMAGPPYSEPALIGMAYAFERVSGLRRPPSSCPSLEACSRK
ncbi:MAG TPA: amidase family protein [Bacillota bacterium]|jgi:amidase|nr:amidase [Fastidiosipila sp.]HPX93235.1 amidase family protein [Bacillota bacterium]HQB81065.1 amidase family protein [Bacillota bacterium]